MCSLIPLELDGGTVMVADIKKKYIENIILSGPLCRDIRRIVLFGSALEERCRTFSDVDIAVFGDTPKHRIYASREYNAFCDAFSFFENDFLSGKQTQEYDILYFDNEEPQDSAFLAEIKKGKTIYVREDS